MMAVYIALVALVIALLAVLILQRREIRRLSEREGELLESLAAVVRSSDRVRDQFERRRKFRLISESQSDSYDRKASPDEE
jgi:signal transduction protein with GAF and PtsI domain